MSRIITVVLKIENQSAAKEFWDAHVARRLIHGCKVQALTEGDLLKEVERLEEELDESSGEGYMHDHEDDLEII